MRIVAIAEQQSLSQRGPKGPRWTLAVRIEGDSTDRRAKDVEVVFIDEPGTGAPMTARTRHGVAAGPLYQSFCRAVRMGSVVPEAETRIWRELYRVRESQRGQPSWWWAIDPGHLNTAGEPLLFGARSREDLRAEYGWRVYQPRVSPKWTADGQPSQVTQKKEHEDE